MRNLDLEKAAFRTPRGAMLGAICLVSTLSALPSFAQMPSPAPPRTVSVSGQGEVRGEPDRALVTLGVEARRLKMEDARAEVAKTVDSVLKLTRDLKLDPKYVHATRVNIQPEYNYDNQARKRSLLGYHVARQVEIELKDLDQLGTLLEKAVDLGVNQVSDPQLDSSRKRDLEREALAKAVEDARKNAETVAGAAGMKLGAARTISAQSVQAPQPMYRQVAMSVAAAESAAPTYQSGEMTFNATVQVEFDLVSP